MNQGNKKHHISIHFQVGICYGQLEAGQVPIHMQGQPTSVAAQPVVAFPESGVRPVYTTN